MAIAAGIVGTADQPAVAALFDMPTEHRRATSLDRRHDTPLDPTEMCAMAPTKRLAVAAEDIRHLQRRTHRRLRMVASPRGAAGRAGSAYCGWCWSQPACS